MLDIETLDTPDPIDDEEVSDAELAIQPPADPEIEGTEGLQE